MDEGRPISLHTQRERDPEGFTRRIYEIRATLSGHVELTSLRQAAREVGMSPTGLSNFLGGAEPYMPTLSKLGTWYEARGRDGGEPMPVQPDAALDVLREAVRLRAERTSARRVAVELGMSSGGVQSFIRGGTRPYGSTLARLQRWYLQGALDGEVPLSPAGMRSVAERLLATVPADQRSDAAGELFAAMYGVFRGRGLDAPEWLIGQSDDTRPSTGTPP